MIPHKDEAWLFTIKHLYIELYLGITDSATAKLSRP